MERKVTIFKNITEIETPFYPTLRAVLERIKTSPKIGLLDVIRTTDDKRQRDKLKKSLPSICFSGEFSRRNSKDLIKHNGLICLDFDGFKDEKRMAKVKKEMTQEPCVMSVFVSPSGKGLKVLVKIPDNPLDHKEHFNALEDYFRLPEFDTSTKDVGRVCYESYDPKIYINPDSILFTDKLAEKSKEIDKSESHTTKTIIVHDEDVIIQKLMVWWNRDYGFVEGSRNSNLLALACALSNYGIPKPSAQAHIVKICSGDSAQAPLKELTSIVDNAYKLASFNNKQFEDTEKVEFVKRQIRNGTSADDIKEILIEQEVKPDIAKSVIKAAEETAHEFVDKFWRKSSKGVVSLVHNKFRDFLVSKGFYKFYPEGSVNFIFVRRVSNRVSNVTDGLIKDFVLKYLEKEITDTSIWDFFAENTRYFKDNFLSFLPQITINFVEDTAKESYLFYQNIAVRITDKEVIPMEYDSLKGWVWDDQMLDRDYNECEEDACDFKQFIHNVADNDPLRIASIESTIGYLMHTYKDPSNPPAVIINDEVISSNPEGGTGKGLFTQGISHLRKMVSIDGKKFDFQKSFPYQRVQQDTQVLAFDDVKPTFNFAFLFSVITEGIELEKKNKDEIKIPFEKSPKIIITTNYAIKGEGSSHDRRKWELEFKQHYKKDFTPFDEFKRRLFQDWDDVEWGKYDKYMVENLRSYLETGLVKSKFKNLIERKFIAETSFDFYEWITQEGQEYALPTGRHLAAIAYNRFVEECPDYRHGGRGFGHSVFNRWMVAFGEYKYGTVAMTGRTSEGKWIEFVVKKDVQMKVGL